MKTSTFTHLPNHLDRSVGPWPGPRDVRSREGVHGAGRAGTTLRRLACVLGAATMVVLAPAASAHHSFALFDTSKTITVQGVVSRFEFTNPHVEIYLESGDPPKRFKVESGSVNALTRKGGWKPDSIKVGDKVEVKFNPLKTGEQLGGLLVEIKDGDTVLKGGG